MNLHKGQSGGADPADLPKSLPMGRDFLGGYRMGPPVDSVNRCLISVAQNGRYHELVTGNYNGL